MGIPSPCYYLSDQVIFRDKSPVPRVLGAMEIVAGHPVVIHFEGIAVLFVTIDKDLAANHFQFIAFIGADDAFVDRIVQRRQLYRCALFRDPERAVIISRPAMSFIIRKYTFGRRIYI